MKHINLKNIAEFVGISAIVASLVFVGMQLKQTQAIAIGDAYQSRAELLIQANSLFFESDKLANIFYKAWGGEPLDDFEAAYLWRYQDVWLAYFENNYFQFRAGLLAEEHWAATRLSLKSDVATNPVFLERWPEHRPKINKPFADLVDELIAEVASEEKPE